MNKDTKNNNDHFTSKNTKGLSLSLLNEMKQTYGQQNCDMLKLNNKDSSDVSSNGGWCVQASSPNSTSHVTDQSFATALSKFLATKTVVSFGDGPGEYKKLLDSFGQVKSYTSYDGAPFCETVTGVWRSAIGNVTDIVEGNVTGGVVGIVTGGVVGNVTGGVVGSVTDSVVGNVTDGVVGSVTGGVVGIVTGGVVGNVTGGV
ncbi:hypothetical protein Btru_068630, partial [Bulinus truncatus]